MITNTTPRDLPPNTPAVILALRKAFDARLTDLYKEAREPLPTGPGESSDAVRHVHFNELGLHVTAVYSTVEDRFTQLIARDVAQVNEERPAFTISVFL